MSLVTCSFDQALNGFELRRFGGPHHFKKRHLEIGLPRAGLSQPRQGNLFALPLSRRYAINQQEDIEPASQEIEHRLSDTDVRFNAADDDLLHIAADEL